MSSDDIVMDLDGEDLEEGDLDGEDLDGDASRGPWRRVLLFGAAVVAIVGAVVAVSGVLDDDASGPAQTVAATRSTVRVMVSGVGTLQSTSSATLGFSGSGEVTAVPVKVGDHVVQGQLLARLDGLLPRATRTAALAQAAAARAQLAQLLSGRSSAERAQTDVQVAQSAQAVAAARRDLRVATRVVATDGRSQRNTVAQAQSALAQAVRRVSTDQTKLTAARARTEATSRSLHTAQTAIATLRSQTDRLAANRRDVAKRQLDESNDRSTAETTLSDARTDLAEARGTLATARTAAAEACRPSTDDSPGTAGDCPAAQRAVNDAQTAAQAAQAKVDRLQLAVNASVGQTTATQKAMLDADFADSQMQRTVDAAQSTLTNAQSRYERARSERDTLRTALPGERDAVRQARATLATARLTSTSSRATAEQTLATAGNAIHTAEMTLRATRAAGAVDNQPARPGPVADARSAVAQADNAVAQADRDVRGSLLLAPAAGVVTRVGVAPGDTVTGGTGTRTASANASASASGGDAGGAGSGGGSSSGGGGGTTSSDASIAIQSPTLSTFTVPLTQADAVKARSGQRATLRLQAVNRTVHGTLTRISPVAGAAGGAVTYAATVTVTDPMPKAMRVGMTADVTLEVATRRNVLAIPPLAAPSGAGSTDSVTVLVRGRPVRRTVRFGLAGDDAVEVLSGLRPGDRVVLPTPDAGGDEGGGDEGGGGDFGGGGGGPGGPGGP